LLRTQRLQEIQRRLGAESEVTVVLLSAELGVSEMTIRRDLQELDSSGLARRVHGGAVLAAHPVRTPFPSRARERGAEKNRIGCTTAELLGPDSSVILDVGTTVFYVARALRERSGLFLATNSVETAVELSGSDNRVLLLGGMVYPAEQERTLVGKPTVDLVRQLSVDTLVLGAGGITLERGLAYFSFEEVEVRNAMLEVARDVVLVADGSKFGKELPISLGALPRVDVLVTDRPLSTPYRRHFKSMGIRVIVA